MNSTTAAIVFVCEVVFVLTFVIVGFAKGWAAAENVPSMYCRLLLALFAPLRWALSVIFLTNIFKPKDDEVTKPSDEPPTFPLTDYNVLDLCMRPYQLITATIDTLNVIALGIIALAFSILVVVIELYGEISPELRTPGFVTLAVAVVITIGAFLMGDVAGLRGWVDMIDGERFVMAYNDFGRAAVLQTIDAVIENTIVIGRFRDRKRFLLFIALLLCIGAAVCFATGRAADQKPPANYDCNGSVGPATPNQKLVLQCR